MTDPLQEGSLNRLVRQLREWGSNKPPGGMDPTDEAADAIERLADALQNLMDWQNGPPIHTQQWITGWEAAMARAALKEPNT